MIAMLRATTTVLLALPLLFLSSCLDPCKDVSCQNGGECNDGNCDCPAGFEGSDCSEAARDKFIGTFVVSETCNSGANSYELTISPGSDDTQIFIRNLYDLNRSFEARIDGSDLTIHPQTIDFATLSGTGTHNGTSLNISLSIVIGDNVDQCTIWGN